MNDRVVESRLKITFLREEPLVIEIYIPTLVDARERCGRNLRVFGLKDSNQAVNRSRANKSATTAEAGTNHVIGRLLIACVSRWEREHNMLSWREDVGSSSVS